MTNLDKIGKDHAKLMLEAFSFLGEEKLEIIKNTKMFKFLNNDYEKTYTRSIYETVKLDKPKEVGVYYKGYKRGKKLITEEHVKVGEKIVTYKDKVRNDKNKEYVEHSQIICRLELDLLSDLDVVTTDEYNRLNSMLLSKDPEIVKLAESIIYEKRKLKQNKIKKLKKKYDTI